MNLRCKAGDMAVVVDHEIRRNNGVLVDVVRSVGLNVWLVRCKGAAVLRDQCNCHPGSFCDAPMATMLDWNLQPIRGLPAPAARQAQVERS